MRCQIQSSIGLKTPSHVNFLITSGMPCSSSTRARSSIVLSYSARQNASRSS